MGVQFRDQPLMLRFSVKERKNSQSQRQDVHQTTQIASADHNRVKSSHPWPSRPAKRDAQLEVHRCNFRSYLDRAGAPRCPGTLTRAAAATRRTRCVTKPALIPRLRPPSTVESACLWQSKLV